MKNANACAFQFSTRSIIIIINLLSYYDNKRNKVQIMFNKSEQKKE